MLIKTMVNHRHPVHICSYMETQVAVTPVVQYAVMVTISREVTC